MVTIEDFSKLEIKIGKILSAEKVPETDRLLKFELDFGSEKRTIVGGEAVDNGRHRRTIVGGWAIAYPDPSILVGTLVPAILNLEPRTIKGIESQGMILGATENDQPVALHPDRDIEPRSIVR